MAPQPLTTQKLNKAEEKRDELAKELGETFQERDKAVQELNGQLDDANAYAVWLEQRGSRALSHPTHLIYTSSSPTQSY